jgi:UDP-GlcNAc:undecaprenyl-phosphate GlcNAc-1-phosphate transferase
MNNGSTVSLIVAFFGALASALVLTPVARSVARRLRIVDCPDGKRKLQSAPTALLGGVAVLLALGVGVASAANLELPGTPVQRACIVASFCFLCAAGAYDDVWNMRARWKLLSQVIAALPLAIGVLEVDGIQLFGVTLETGALGWFFALVWLVSAVNAINLIDGMDGLASTTGICIALSISMLAWCTGHVACAPFAMALAGALLGFLCFNRPPASIYLGDAGSMVIGLTLAALSIRSATSSEGNVSIAPLVLVLGLPLTDTSLAIIRRWLSGHGISQPDRLHIHHRLIDAGMRVPQILALVAGICLALGALAAAAIASGMDSVALAAAGIFATVMLRARLIGHYELTLAKAWLARRAVQRIGSTSGATEAAGSIAMLRIFEQPTDSDVVEAASEERRAA